MQVGNNTQRQNNGHNPQRNINKEYPAPVGIAGNKPTQRWANNRSNQRGPGQCGDGCNQLVFRCRAQDGQTTDGHHQRAAHPLQDTHGDKLIDCVRQPAKNRGQREDRQCKGKYFARAEAVGNPAAGGDEHGKRNEIGADPDIQIHRLHAETLRHVGQGGGNHRPVKKLHKESTGNQQRRRR